MTSLKESGRDSMDRDSMDRDSRASTSPPKPEEQSASESFQESAVSHDKPMERKTPQAPFALVGLSYLAVLAIIGLIIGLVLFALS